MKDSDSGKRVSRLNPPEEWIVKELPEVRIVDDELWQGVKARQKATKVKPTDDGQAIENHFRERRRPKYLLSGLTHCGCCGGGYSMISANLLGCATARNKGSNRLNVRRDRLEAPVLNALRDQLMDPQLFATFSDEFTRGEPRPY